MKKITFSIFIAFLLFLIPEKKNGINNFSLTIMQNKALADGEIIVYPSCAHVSTNFCFLDRETGFFILGERY